MQDTHHYKYMFPSSKDIINLNHSQTNKHKSGTFFGTEQHPLILMHSEYM